MTTNFSNLVRKFHSDEEGLEALQVVMIIAIAALIMIAAATVGKEAVTWMGNKWNDLKKADTGQPNAIGLPATQ
jgi:Flp pilus assembly pilin Flp